MRSLPAGHAHRATAAGQGRCEGQSSATQVSGRAVLLRSWRRCRREFGLRRRDSPVEVVLEDCELRRRQERLGEFLALAQVEMGHLFRRVESSGCTVLLTDAAGTIMHQVQDGAMGPEFARARVIAGADWSERHAGTNGMGTCVAEGRPVTVFREEHYLVCNAPLSCSAAPIHDPAGQLLAVLDVSSVHRGDTRENQQHTAALVNLSAGLIEHSNFLRENRSRCVLRIHRRPEFLGLADEALLAVGADGVIQAASRGAPGLLGAGSRAELRGRRLGQLFDVSADLVERVGQGRLRSVWPIRLHGGGEFWALCHGPVEAPELPGSGALACARRPGLAEIREPADSPFAELVAGADPRVLETVSRARRLVDKPVPVLLCGETGTGKEALARAMHQASQRADRPFVAVNCASIPESLVESELFGYGPGAFTGARREGMRGKIRQSSGGTLFLDEIGDMPPVLQTRLLRVLEQQEVLPLGSDEPVQVDLHVISATHRDLAERVAEGLFREDLYYRLNGVTLSLPALRERVDRADLIQRLLDAENETGEPVRLDDRARNCLLRYRWPGNIRQLRNCLCAALALCEGGAIDVSLLPDEVVREAGPAPAPRAATASEDDLPLAHAERQALLEVLEQHRWNITGAAAALGMSRKTVYRKLKRHGVQLAAERR